MTYQELFAAVAIVLPIERSFKIKVSSWLHRSTHTITTEWEVYVPGLWSVTGSSAKEAYDALVLRLGGAPALDQVSGDVGSGVVSLP